MGADLSGDTPPPQTQLLVSYCLVLSGLHRGRGWLVVGMRDVFWLWFGELQSERQHRFTSLLATIAGKREESCSLNGQSGWTKRD